MNAFSRLAPPIQDYIYKNRWEELREIQVASIDIILNTANHLLLCSGTASGKTEAAFLPILTDLYHPTQILADFLTVREYVPKPFNKVKFVYVGDARNNMGNSLMIGAAKMGMEFWGIAPKELWPSEDLVKEMKEVAKETGASLNFSESIEDVKGADVIYTDVWVSMGEEAQFEQRIKLLKPYQVNMDMIKKTGNPNVIFLHCLPSFHDLNTTTGKEIHEKFGLKEMEVTDEVFRSKYSRVFDEAENRMHTIKAVIVATIGKL